MVRTGAAAGFEIRSCADIPEERYYAILLCNAGYSRRESQLPSYAMSGTHIRKPPVYPPMQSPVLAQAMPLLALPSHVRRAISGTETEPFWSNLRWEGTMSGPETACCEPV